VQPVEPLERFVRAPRGSLDQPMLVEALEKAGIPYTAFKYAENTGQFQPIREQTGTFADTMKLWSAA